MKSTWLVCAALVAGLSSTSVSATRYLEALERFDLSELRIWLVELTGDCGPSVSFLDPQNYAYHAKLGSQVGKFDGRISKITRDEILIVELRPDGAGYKEVTVRIPVPKNASVH